MAEIPEGITLKELERYTHLDAGIKKLADEKSDLNDKIKKAFTKIGTFIFPSEKFGFITVKLGTQNRVDNKALEAAFPEEKYPQYYRSQFDPSLVDDKSKSKFKTPTTTLSVSSAE